jgi:hypothetical protein
MGYRRMESVSNVPRKTAEHSLSSTVQTLPANPHTSAASSRLNCRPRRRLGSYISPKDETSFLRVCHPILTALHFFPYVSLALCTAVCTCHSPCVLLSVRVTRPVYCCLYVSLALCVLLSVRVTRPVYCCLYVSLALCELLSVRVTRPVYCCLFVSLALCTAVCSCHSPCVLLSVRVTCTVQCSCGTCSRQKCFDLRTFRNSYIFSTTSQKFRSHAR